MKEGQLLDYTIKLLGVKIRWRTLITDYVPKKKFIDQQIKGPYSMWYHMHEFKEYNNVVKMTDTINYVLPFGILDNIINNIWIKRNLEKIFQYRSLKIEKHFNKE